MRLLEAVKEYRASRLSAIDDQASGLTLLNLDNSVKAVSSMPHASGWGGWLNNYGMGVTPWSYAGTNIDYAAAVGDLRTSSLLMSAVRWVGRNLCSARLRVVSLDSDQKETEIANHGMSQLFRRPNPYYSGKSLWRAFAVSWIWAGECYFIKVRSRAGRLVELWYEPHWTIRPVWPDDGSEFISHFEIYRDGKWLRLEKEDVFPIYDSIDPETRRGISATSALLREFYTDQQAAHFMALLLKNGLVPPIAVSFGDKDRPFNGNLEEHKSTMLRKMRGDSAGEPFFSTDTVKVEKLGFDYSSVGMKEVREIPEERFAAAVGISVISLMLGAGLKHSAYQNVKEYHAHDYRSYIVPLNDQIAEEGNVHILPEYGDTSRVETRWDYSQVPVMQPDKDKEWRLMFQGFKDRVFNRSQALEGVGYKPEPGDEEIYYPVPSSNVTISPMAESEPVNEESLVKPNGHATMTEDEMKAAKVPSDKDIDSYASHWSEIAPEGARGLFDATVKPS